MSSSYRHLFEGEKQKKRKMDMLYFAMGGTALSLLFQCALYISE
jgi:hypothetical protein